MSIHSFSKLIFLLDSWRAHKDAAYEKKKKKKKKKKEIVCAELFEKQTVYITNIVFIF